MKNVMSKLVWSLVFFMLIIAAGLYALGTWIYNLITFTYRARGWQSVTMAMAVMGTVFFAAQWVGSIIYAMPITVMPSAPVHLQVYTRESPKDAEQDEHMKSTDDRLTEIVHAQEKTYAEGIDYTRLVNAQIKEMGERISHDEGIAFGLFAGIGILQGIGLMKGSSHTGAHIHGQRPPTNPVP